MKISTAALLERAHRNGAAIGTANGALSPMQIGAMVAKPAPPPPAEPVTVNLDAGAVERAAASQAKSVADLTTLVGALVQAMREQNQSSPASIKAWDFEITRNDKGVSKIRATAIR